MAEVESFPGMTWPLPIIRRWMRNPEGIPKHKGKMLIDATVCEQAIRYPTDMSLLNESREISESVIDDLYKLSDLHKSQELIGKKPDVII